MGRRILAIAAVLVLAGAVAGFAFDPDELNKITFQNNTGAKIGYFVHYPGKSFKFDIMATDNKGNKFEIHDFVMTDGKEASVTLTKSNLDQEAPDFTLATVHIENNTGHELQYLFVSPDDSDAWGVDLLDEETTVPDGEEHSFVLAVGSQKVKYNLMAVDENDDEYKFNMTIDPNKKKEFTWSIDPSDLDNGN